MQTRNDSSQLRRGSYNFLAPVIRTILEIYSLYASIHELRATLQVHLMTPRRIEREDFSKLTLKVINYCRVCTSSYFSYYYVNYGTPIYFLIARSACAIYALRRAYPRAFYTQICLISRVNMKSPPPFFRACEPR